MSSVWCHDTLPWLISFSLGGVIREMTPKDAQISRQPETDKANATAGSATVDRRDTESSVKEQIEKALGKSYRNVPRVWDVQIKGQAINVRFSIQDNLTSGLVKHGAKNDIKIILKAVQDSRYPYSEINVVGTAQMQDKFGNSQEAEVIRATYLHTTVDKINWSGFLSDNIYEIADGVWLHRDFQ
jgi:hypothetical protein